MKDVENFKERKMGELSLIFIEKKKRKSINLMGEKELGMSSKTKMN